MNIVGQTDIVKSTQEDILSRTVYFLKGLRAELFGDLELQKFTIEIRRKIRKIFCMIFCIAVQYYIKLLKKTFCPRT